MTTEGDPVSILERIRHRANNPTDDSVRPLVLVSGGGMSGVFSASVLSVLLRHNLAKGITAMSGSSAAAPVIAYFASGEMERALEQIYFGYCCESALWVPDVNIMQKRIDGLMDLMRGTVGGASLDFDAVKAFTGALYVPVADAYTAKGELHDMRTVPDMRAYLKAAISLPVICNPVQLDGLTHDTGEYFDGGIGEYALPFVELLERERITHVLVIMNYNPGTIPPYADIIIRTAKAFGTITSAIAHAATTRHERVHEELDCVRKSNIPFGIIWGPKVNPLDRRKSRLKNVSEQAMSDMEELVSRAVR
jgi:predicted patatin/cPLA2 family phospholipase